MNAARILFPPAALALMLSCIREDTSDQNQAKVIAEALAIYKRKAFGGEDFSSGPCIAETIFEDWSVDIAHVTRQLIDDLPENQCQFYRDGKTHHFIELTPQGDVIRAE